MKTADAQLYVGNMCAIEWENRTGEKISTVSKVHDVGHLPFYGSFLIADKDDIFLDRIHSIDLVAQDPTAQSSNDEASRELVSAA